MKEEHQVHAHLADCEGGQQDRHAGLGGARGVPAATSTDL